MLKHTRWRRLTLALAILLVIALSTTLKLPADVVTALVVAFSSAAQFFFQQHDTTDSHADDQLLPPAA